MRIMLGFVIRGKHRKGNKNMGVISGDFTGFGLRG